MKFRAIRVADGTQAYLIDSGAYTAASPALDGDHAYSAVRADLWAVYSLLAPNAAVLLHDALNPDVGRAVADAVAEDSWVDCGLLSGEPHFQDGQVWGGLRLLRKGKQ